MVTPADPTDARTRFIVQEPGRYDVTITATDGAGQTASDTLYVYVEGAGDSPSLSPASPSPWSPPWYSSWDTPSGGDEPDTPTGEEDDEPKPPLDMGKRHGTLVIKGSDVTFKEDIAYRSYADYGKLEGLNMGDGDSPLNEVVEGFNGIKNGVIQVFVGTEAKTLEYKVSGPTAQKIQNMSDYSAGKHEDEIAEQLNAKSDAPAVKEDYILNDARVVDGVRKSAEVVTVTVHVTENKGLTDYAASAIGTGVNMAGKTAKTATSTITNKAKQAMNFLGGPNG